mmetsp:Transcript_8278/g.11381  ORF Transcript_8278/g.11381 Transcript_8278/m.11381 type:complete len:86 (-) Transcript_8278:78-335(-)
MSLMVINPTPSTLLSNTSLLAVESSSKLAALEKDPCIIASLNENDPPSKSKRKSLISCDVVSLRVQIDFNIICGEMGSIKELLFL